jgi:TRAP-type C4-dicarboxylate transport system substrate-binding protein
MKQSTFIKFFVAVVFGVCCFIAFHNHAVAQVITVKVANWFPVGSKHDLVLKEWSEDLQKRAGGKVKVSYYPAGTLVPAAQQYDAVVSGIADVSNAVLGYTMGRFPFSYVLDYPIGWPIESEQGAVPTIIANEFYKKFKPKEFDDVKVLLFHAEPGGFLSTRDRPVTKLEDVKGLKIRCFGTNAKFVSFLGGAPVAMPASEAYDALSKGVVEGIMQPYEALQTFRTGECIKYGTLNTKSAYGGTFVVSMNKRKFNSLPTDVQAIIDKMSEEYMLKYGKAWVELTADGKTWLKARGVKFISLSPQEEDRWFEKGTKPILAAYVKDMKARGLPGEEAVKFLLDSINKYRKQ